MLIDWFTVGAQVVNFLVLVVVLKLVLFDRIVEAMDRREADIASRISRAEEREAEAEERASSYRTRKRELDEQADRRMEEAEAAAARRRSELVDEAREHVGELRAGWEDALRRERVHFLEEVRRRTGEQVCTISRQALRDLADADLESQVVHVAMARLDADRERLRPLVDEHADDGAGVAVRTGFELGEDLAGRLVTTIAARLGCDESDVTLARDEELVCGLEIRVGSWSVGWSIDGYLDTVAEELDSLLLVADDRPAGDPPTERGP